MTRIGILVADDQPLVRAGIRRVHPASGHFAENGNLRQAGADVVVEIAGDPSPHMLELMHAAKPKTVQRVRAHRQSAGSSTE